MTAEQAHGFSFEKWVRDNFFDEFDASYTQLWDVPKEENTAAKCLLPSSMNNLPISIKSVKQGSVIDLGDARKQRDITYPFLFVVGFWRQTSPTEKTFTNIEVAKIEPHMWKKAWGHITPQHIEELDALVKIRSITPQEARAQAKEWKANHPEVSNNGISLNPKIDSKKQRRLQCSLKLDTFYAMCLPSSPTLFGKSFTMNPVLSSARFQTEEPTIESSS